MTLAICAARPGRKSVRRVHAAFVCIGGGAGLMAFFTSGIEVAASSPSQFDETKAAQEFAVLIQKPPHHPQAAQTFASGKWVPSMKRFAALEFHLRVGHDGSMNIAPCRIAILWAE